MVRRCRDDRARRSAWCECRRARRGLLRHASGECLLQQRPDALGPAVLDLINVEAHAGAVGAGLVEALDPLLRLLQVFGLWRDDQERVHALDRDDAQDACERALVWRAERLIELRHYRLDIGTLQREEPGRHARHPVDVEHLDGGEQVLQLELGARKDQEVAQVIHAYRRLILDEGLEERRHLAHAHIVQRHDQHGETGLKRAARAAELRRDVAAHRGRGRQNLPDAGLPGHRRAVHPQQQLHGRVERLARDARGGTNRHGTAHRRIDRVGLVQDIAQDVSSDFADVRAFEVERHRRSGRRRRLGLGCHRAALFLFLDEDAGALVELRLLRRLLRRSAQCGTGVLRSALRSGSWCGGSLPVLGGRARNQCEREQ